MTRTWIEGADDYADVVAMLNNRTRLIRSADTRPATQWILQFRSSARWRSDKFFQDKRAMLALYVNEGFLEQTIDPQAQAILNALPDYCPQRANKPLS